jgi:hypothetical protein
MKKLLMLALGATVSLNANLAPLAGFLSAGAATAATAHHWYKQLKPFKNEAERQAALKDIILTESIFTHHLGKKEYEEFKQNIAPLEIYESWDAEIQEKNGIIYLGLNAYPAFEKHSNRLHLKNALFNIFVTLGHEGAHVAQGAKNLRHVGGYGIWEKRELPRIHFDKESLLSEDLPDADFLIRPKPVTDTQLMRDKNFQLLAHEFHITTQEYDKYYQRYVGTKHLLESSKSKYLKELRKTHLEKIRSAALNKMKAMVQASRQVAKYIETDADIQAITAVLNTDIITTKQKLKALSDQQDFFSGVWGFDRTHPLPSLRIQMLEKAKKHLQPLIAFEAGTKSMSKFWDPAL